MARKLRRTKPCDGQRVRLRVQDGRRELRVDGSFASSFTPGQVATGSVWDALAAALLALPAARRRRPPWPDGRVRVLLLGLGGGSVARLLRALSPRAVLLGVERDPDVLRLARSAFDLDALDVSVVTGDAVAFLARTRRRFDVIIEDCFIGAEAQLRKPPGIPEPAFSFATARLLPGGVLASNTIDESDEIARALGAHFRRVLQISLAGYDNRILLARNGALDARVLRQRVAAQPLFAATLPLMSFRTLAARARCVQRRPLIMRYRHPNPRALP